MSEPMLPFDDEAPTVRLKPDTTETGTTVRLKADTTDVVSVVSGTVVSGSVRLPLGGPQGRQPDRIDSGGGSGSGQPNRDDDAVRREGLVGLREQADQRE